MNRSAHFLLFACLCLGLATVSSLAAQQSNQDASASIPHLIRFSGVLKDGEGKPAQGTVGITFAFYKDQQGGTPLWMESQDVAPDATGRYSVMLGTTKNDGLPEQLFIAKEARWLSVEPQSLPAPARVLLLSVPYALKAADAETIGGLPPSAFALAAPPITSATPAPAASTSNVLPASSSVTTSGGTGNLIPLFSTATDIENSAVSQTGSGSTAKIGINTTAPASTLDVKGTATVRGTFSLPATGVATATGGKSSQPANLAASVFNSSSSAAVAQTFQFKAEPTGNNTTAPSGTLNFLYGAGTSAPAETGLKIKSNGQITFATGRTFPTGNGTITGVTAGTDLIGGGTSGTVTLSVDTTKVVTGVTAGTDLTGGGVGGVPTLTLDTTKVPQLNSANTFTANQAVTGNLTATGAVTGSTVSATSRFNLGAAYLHSVQP
jgi:trimeric autotransporter adhesin